MKDWKKSVISPAATVADAVESLNTTGSRIVLVAGEGMKLQGLVTDGDLRRGLLSGATLQDPVTRIMSRASATAKPSDTNAHLAALMTERSFLHLPVVDEAGALVGVKTLAEVMTTPSRENWVIIMAGGLGAFLWTGRLRQGFKRRLDAAAHGPRRGCSRTSRPGRERS